MTSAETKIYGYIIASRDWERNHVIQFLFVTFARKDQGAIFESLVVKDVLLIWSPDRCHKQGTQVPDESFYSYLAGIDITDVYVRFDYH